MRKLLRNAPARCLRSFGYCRDALKSTFAKEESFRLETLGYAILLILMLLFDWEGWKIIAMSATYLLIPFAEVVNSAIEDVCDLVTVERSPLVKSAKDKGALAVLFAIVTNALALWALIIM